MTKKLQEICPHCHQPILPPDTRRCGHPGCMSVLRIDNKSGFCSRHYDKLEERKKNRHKSKTS